MVSPWSSWVGQRRTVCLETQLQFSVHVQTRQSLEGQQFQLQKDEQLMDNGGAHNTTKLRDGSRRKK